VIQGDEPRSSLSVGIQWASRITSVGLKFGLPPLLGALLDRRLGSSPLALLVGALLGFAAGMFDILQIAREGSRPRPGSAGEAERGGRRPSN
jgi:F0F1-type ATP synthase assembly protein I